MATVNELSVLEAASAAHGQTTVSVDGTRFTIKYGPEEAHHKSILKQTLESESGFFKAMFRNPCQETETGEIILHDDDLHALETILSILNQLPDQPIWYQVDAILHGIYDTMENFDLWQMPIPSLGDEAEFKALNQVLELFFIADKYHMGSLRQCLVSWVIPDMVAKYLDMHFGHSISVDDWLKHFFHRVQERLGGTFPDDLFHVFNDVVTHFIDVEEDVEKLMNEADEYPRLLSLISRSLASKLAETRLDSNFWEQQKKYAVFERDVAQGWRPVRPKTAGTEAEWARQFERYDKIALGDIDYDNEEYTDMED